MAKFGFLWRHAKIFELLSIQATTHFEPPIVAADAEGGCGAFQDSSRIQFDKYCEIWFRGHAKIFELLSSVPATHFESPL